MVFITPSNLTNMFDLFNNVNAVSGGAFMPIITITFSMVVFASALSFNGNAAASFTLACFFGFIASVFFGFLSLVTGQLSLYFLVLFLFGLFWMRYS